MTPPLTPSEALAMAMQSPGHLGPEATETWFASSGMIHRARLLAAANVISTLSLLGFEVRRKEEVPKFRKPTAEEKAFALDRWRLERLESDIAADDREDADEQRKGGAT